MENRKIQEEIKSGAIRKFYIPGIVLGAVSVLLSFFCLPAAGVITGVVSLTLNVIKRREYRTAIGIVLAVLGLLSAIGWWIMLFYLK